MSLLAQIVPCVIVVCAAAGVVTANLVKPRWPRHTTPAPDHIVAGTDFDPDRYDVAWDTSPDRRRQVAAVFYALAGVGLAGETFTMRTISAVIMVGVCALAGIFAAVHSWRLARQPRLAVSYHGQPGQAVRVERTPRND